MRNRVSVAGLAVAAFVFAAASGCGPSFAIVKQGNPNPFVGVKDFSLNNMSYPTDGLKVGDKTEEAYLMSLKPGEAEEWQKEKEDAQGKFAAGLVNNKDGFTFSQVPQGQTAASDKFTIRPVLRHVEPGVFTGVYNMATSMRIVLEILDKSGAVVDQVNFRSHTVANLYHPSTPQRLNETGEKLAERVLEYLKWRTGGGK